VTVFSSFVKDVEQPFSTRHTVHTRGPCLKTWTIPALPPTPPFSQTMTPTNPPRVKTGAAAEYTASPAKQESLRLLGPLGFGNRHPSSVDRARDHNLGDHGSPPHALSLFGAAPTPEQLSVRQNAAQSSAHSPPAIVNCTSSGREETRIEIAG